MSSIQKNSNNEKLIGSEKKTPEYQEINKDLSSQEDLNTSVLDNSDDITESKHVLLNTFVNITVELGKSKIKIKDFLSLSKGSMLILDKTIKEPLDIFINGHLIASGEIVVSEKKYGLRITSIKNSLKTMNILS
ncbi:flagellar motor switch protein FliN [Buchnera aphidicola str. Ak (Acyrthosiphon kondoi)]|uniref:Flagellar motor switch protein FliN n=1 Tax=Buchnera aphidicola str. Ak (Acyrthosiphon kondoi) TaxID=1005090 RepID=G2LMF7_9GAMM|nr:flagellar motor switch protein FliN [Buchnera aphidicola]AEO08445.1 flagellar motor switch protein FliN [Buchnera aphidicola str. Ak (Acyrthosiphon kondoi)]WAI18199.1 MAG: flagellar motor switch protein FliN [Buchnera aphidicola (Acyrthosiphon caraganae)]